MWSNCCLECPVLQADTAARVDTAAEEPCFPLNGQQLPAFRNFAEATAAGVASALQTADSEQHKAALCQLSLWLDEGHGAAVGAALAEQGEQLHGLLGSDSYSIQRHADSVLARLMQASPPLWAVIMPMVEHNMAAEAVRCCPESSVCALHVHDDYRNMPQSATVTSLMRNLYG